MKSHLPPILVLVAVLIVFLTVTDSHSQQKYPVATPTNQPGVVISPYGKDRKLDVAGLAPGSLVEDPVEKKIFRIPFDNPSARSGNNPMPRQPSAPAGPEGNSRNLIPGIPGGGSGSTSPTPQELPPLPNSAGGTLPRELADFLYSFNEASSVNDPSALAPFYANRVESYFGKRDMSQSEIHKDRANYINRYPERQYSLMGAPVLLSSDGNNFEVMTRLNYRTRGRSGIRSGSVSDYLRIRRSSHGFKIFAIEEAKAGAVPPEIQRQDALTLQPSQTMSNQPLPDAGNNLPPPSGGGFQDIERFVEAFSASGQINEPSACVDFMHSRVENYYGTKLPSREALLRDRSNYIRRWPQRRYWLAEAPRITPQNDGTFQVVSKVGYEVRNGSKRSSGVANSIARVANTPNGLRIVSIREK